MSADCPNAAEHTPHPSGYLNHGAWAEAMLRTHTQHRCPGCGLWLIWRPKITEADRPRDRLGGSPPSEPKEGT